MSDLIDRQVAIDKLQKEINEWTPPFDDVMGAIRCGVRLARNIIEDLPSAQPQRKKGKWITVEGRLGNGVECNQCHSVFWYWMGNYRFCPSCGVDMRGESE